MIRLAELLPSRLGDEFVAAAGWVETILLYFTITLGESATDNKRTQFEKWAAVLCAAKNPGFLSQGNFEQMCAVDVVLLAAAENVLDLLEDIVEVNSDFAVEELGEAAVNTTRNALATAREVFDHLSHVGLD